MVLSNNIAELTAYLGKVNWLLEEEKILANEIPGEGNMNFTLRLITNKRSIIIKQSREFVEKYPQVAAPKERALMEAAFYKITEADDRLSDQMPTIIGVDKESSILLMEDLGKGTDFSRIYKKGESISEGNLIQLMDFAADLHNGFQLNGEESPLRNMAMRKLNHEHIYLYPYLDENGLDLDDILPGLAAVAKDFKEDSELKIKLEKIGNSYLADGNTLLHGDFFPGSWLQTTDGIKIIDPEFCFYGTPEFEIGVFKAHLKMADQPEELIDKAIKYYQSKAKLDLERMEKYCAVEILRRILGLAQLPLELDLNSREVLLNEAAKTIKG